MEQPARVGLGPFDRIVLVSAWLLSCAAVYGLGFYTGSHTQERLPGDENRIVRLPVTSQPPPAGQRVNDPEDLSFWGVLESGGPRSKPGEGIRTPATPAAPAAAPKSDAPAKAASAGRAKAATSRPGRRPAAKPAPAGTAAKPAPGKQTASVPSRKPGSAAPRGGSAGTTRAASVAPGSRPAEKPSTAKPPPPAAGTAKRPPRATEGKLERTAPPSARNDVRAVPRRSVAAAE